VSRLRDKKREASLPHPIQYARSVSREAIIDLAVISAISVVGYWIRLDKLTGYSCEDDAAYVAACGLILRGYRPYTDFFLAHPPGFFFFVALLWKMLGLENPERMWFAGKMVSFLSFIATGATIYLLCRNLLKNREAGLFGVLIYQLSSQTLLFSTACAPQLPATLLIVASVYLLLDRKKKTKRRLFILGFLLGLALTTRLSALYLLPPFLLYLILEKRGKRWEWGGLVSIISGLLLPLSIILMAAPIGDLWSDLVLFHFLKGRATIGEKIGKFLSILTRREIPHLLGLISIPYVLKKREMRLNFLIGQGILLLSPYFMQATPGAHLLIESSPFFVILTAISISETTRQIFDKRRPIFAVCLSVLLLSTLFVGLPSTVTELSKVLHKPTLEGRIYRRLVKIVERETGEDDIVFSQIPLVPFLAGRDYPPLIDTSQSAKNAGIYTPETVADLILRYRVRLLIVWYRTGDDLSNFLLSQGFVKLDNLGGYIVYIKK